MEIVLLCYVMVLCAVLSEIRMTSRIDEHSSLSSLEEGYVWITTIPL